MERRGGQWKEASPGGSDLVDKREEGKPKRRKKRKKKEMRKKTREKKRKKGEEEKRKIFGVPTVEAWQFEN